MTLTERINQLLTKMIKEEKRITQAELAERVGVAPASVNKWLNGGAPAVDKLPLLCEIFDISPNQLFGYESEYPIEAVELFRAFQKHPEYQSSVKKLLDMIIRDIEQKENR